MGRRKSEQSLHPHGAEPKRGSHIAWTYRSAAAGQVDGGPAAAAGSEAAVLKRDARRQPAAELPRIGKSRHIRSFDAVQIELFRRL